MKIRGRLLTVASTLLAGFISVSASVAQAQKHYPIEDKSEWSTGKYIQQHMIDVGDLPGHKVRILEVQRTYNDKSQLAVSSVKVKEAWVRGYSDYTQGKGKAWGYSIWLLDDGNKVYMEWAGTTASETSAAGSIEGIFNGVT